MSARAEPTPSKLLDECGICGHAIFWCRMESPRRRVAVEALEKRRGDIAVQTQIGSDDLVAVIVGTGTFYRLHHVQGRCTARPFSRAPGAGKKVR